jgi:hypothetical protein
MTTPAEPRSAAFASGISGDGSGVQTATALPQVTQVNPAFDATGSTLQIPNLIKSANAVSARTYLAQVLPYAAKSSPMARAQSQESGRQ